MSDAGQHADDLVRRAIVASRELPESLGPSAAILSQTSAALREAALWPQKSFLFERITHMSWASKVSTVLGIAASYDAHCAKRFALCRQGRKVGYARHAHFLVQAYRQKEYRVIYADLSAKEIAPDEVPQMPESASPSKL